MDVDARTPAAGDQGSLGQDRSWADRFSRAGIGISLLTAVLVILFGVVAIPMVVIAEQIGLSASPGSPVDTAPSLPGQEIATNAGCVACHSTDGTVGAGPSWLGLSGSQRTLDTGEIVTADDAYLHNSILDPASQVVEGFNPIMPADYGERLSEDEIASLIDYINSLS